MSIDPNLWHVWVEFHGPVDGLHCIHLCCAEAPPWCCLWGESGGGAVREMPITGEVYVLEFRSTLWIWWTNLQTPSCCELYSINSNFNSNTLQKTGPKKKKKNSMELVYSPLQGYPLQGFRNNFYQVIRYVLVWDGSRFEQCWCVAYSCWLWQADVWNPQDRGNTISVFG